MHPAFLAISALVELKNNFLYRLDITDPRALDQIISDLRDDYEQISANFIEVPRNPGL